MPADMEMVPISRTIGRDQFVDEMVIKFTHSVEMDWMLPGIPPTGLRVEVPLVVISAHCLRYKFCRLSAGGRWIRTSSSAPVEKGFKASSETGPIDWRHDGIMRALARLGNRDVTVTIRP
jgi:hypothetical protein